MSGSTCDTSVLVAETARQHGLRLLTRDRRARPTYEAVGVDWVAG